MTNLPVRQGRGSWVDVGLKKPVQIDRKIQQNVRVTVKLDLPADPKKQPTRGVVVPPREPLTKAVDIGDIELVLHPLSAVWSQSPYKGGYDLTVGTSDKGTIVIDDPVPEIPSFSHLLVNWRSCRYRGLRRKRRCVGCRSHRHTPCSICT